MLLYNQIPSSRFLFHWWWVWKKKKKKTLSNHFLPLCVCISLWFSRITLRPFCAHSDLSPSKKVAHSSRSFVSSSLLNVCDQRVHVSCSLIQWSVGEIWNMCSTVLFSFFFFLFFFFLFLSFSLESALFVILFCSGYTRMFVLNMLSTFLPSCFFRYPPLCLITHFGSPASWALVQISKPSVKFSSRSSLPWKR